MRCGGAGQLGAGFACAVGGVNLAVVGKDAQQVKTGRPATTCYVEMEVWSDRYEEGISIAEAIRTKLDGLTTEWADGALRLRSCYLDNAYEDATQDGLYVQALRFRMSS